MLAAMREGLHVKFSLKLTKTKQDLNKHTIFFRKIVRYHLLWNNFRGSKFVTRQRRKDTEILICAPRYVRMFQNVKVVDMNITVINCCDKNIKLLITLYPYRDYLFCWLSDYIESNIYVITLQYIKNLIH